MTLEIIPVHFNNEIHEKEKLAKLIISSSKKKIQDNDIVVISQKIVSKQEGRVVNLSSVIPSLLAVGIAAEYNKDAKLVEVILSESKRIVRMENEIIIVENKNGIICANAGVDESNIEEGFATLLPNEPDKSAEKIRKEIYEETKKKVAVLISDTFGRPFRMGQTNCAIGLSGMNSIVDYQGTKDNFRKTMRVTAIAVADEICAASELVMGKTLRCPVAIIRNIKFKESDDSSNSLIRPENEDLFR